MLPHFRSVYRLSSSHDFALHSGDETWSGC
jgi:hypothetical protein